MIAIHRMENQLIKSLPKDRLRAVLVEICQDGLKTYTSCYSNSPCYFQSNCEYVLQNITGREEEWGAVFYRNSSKKPMSYTLATRDPPCRCIYNYQPLFDLIQSMQNRHILLSQRNADNT
jgi:hypothetical protein